MSLKLIIARGGAKCPEVKFWKEHQISRIFALDVQNFISFKKLICDW